MTITEIETAKQMLEKHAIAWETMSTDNKSFVLSVTFDNGSQKIFYAMDHVESFLNILQLREVCS